MLLKLLMRSISRTSRRVFEAIFEALYSLAYRLPAELHFLIMNNFYKYFIVYMACNKENFLNYFKFKDRCYTFTSKVTQLKKLSFLERRKMNN